MAPTPTPLKNPDRPVPVKIQRAKMMDALSMMGIDPSVCTSVTFRPDGLFVEIFVMEGEIRMTADRELVTERYYVRIEG